MQGRPVAFREAGAGGAAPLVLLHGGGFDGALPTWAATFPGLATGRRVILPDLPGYGGSAGFARTHTLADLAGWLGDFLDTLGIARADLCGVSMGAGAGLLLALERPDRVRRMIAAGSYGLMRRVRYHPLAAYAARRGWMRHLYAVGVRGGLPLRLALAAEWGGALRVPPAALAEFQALAREQRVKRSFDDFLAGEMSSAGLLSDLTPRLPDLAAPVLLVHGRHDRVVPVRYAEAAAPLLRDGRLRILPTGHWPMRSRPDLFLPLAEGFLGG
ncbi:alpha/beta fold hydrolase [Oceaniglobus roseus]|uniref:alpha/beta fold hydrolase n=1 Tax=Oceaniglobus roseus TaxID=1737570 RepID=UPI00130004E8|nr:alpha/beta fold hydrolase [Kandeliimicrobium roseum]